MVRGLNVGNNKQHRPKIVVIGGGTGLSVMLRGLKEKPMDITAIVTVADDGGSSGRLRNELHMPPPGDIRNVLIALADTEPLLSQVLQYRFKNGSGLAGHSLGNLMLAAMKEISGDFVTAVKQLSRVLAVRGRVLPASNEAIVLHAEMEDGTIVSGESQIPTVGKRIKRVFIDPTDSKPLDESIEAIREADGILIGPGSLYTSILPNLLVTGISEEIVKSSAVKMFVCNVMTQPGETDNFTVGDHLQAIYDHVGHHLFDYVIVNNSTIPKKMQKKYAEQGATPVTLDLDRVEEKGFKVIADHLVMFQTLLRHDANRLSHHIFELTDSWSARRL
jgi:uncharacterized cofD-like protein